MPATVSVKQATGVTPTYTTITNLRFNTDDTANPGTTNPLVKPAPAGTNYSFWKVVALNADTAPSNAINNIRFFTPGSLGWTGVTVYGINASAYTEATGTTGTTGTLLNGTNYPSISGATALISTYTSGSPLAVPGTLVNINDKSNFVVMQANVADTAVAGTLSAVTVTFRYDET